MNLLLRYPKMHETGPNYILCKIPIFFYYHIFTQKVWTSFEFMNLLKFFFLASHLFYFIWYSARFFSVDFADLSAPEWQQWQKMKWSADRRNFIGAVKQEWLFYLVKLCSCDEQVLFVQNKTSKSINLLLYKRELLPWKLETNTVVSEIIMCWSCFEKWSDGRRTRVNIEYVQGCELTC